MNYRPTCNSYFSGAGGLDTGLMQADVNVVQSLDLDKEATDCMLSNSHYFGHSVLLEDIKNKMIAGQPRPDIMAFTYPCTKYSTIADISGTRTGEELYLHALRHVTHMKPEMYIVENVPGMKKFPVVMETLAQLPDYFIQVFCPLDAAIWLPQKRKRLIIIATRKHFHIPEPDMCIKRPRIKDIIERDAEIVLNNCVLSRINGEYRDKPIIVDPEDANALAPTCVAHYAKDQGTRLVKDKRSPYGVRPFTVREYARLQGFPDDYKFPSTLNAYKLIGNAVPVDMGRWIGEMAVKYFNKDSQARSKPAVETKQADRPFFAPAASVPLEIKGKFEYFYYKDGTALFGDTKLYKEDLGKNGLRGRYNQFLIHPVTGKQTKGWVFTAKPEKIKEVETFFSVTCQTAAFSKAA